MKCQSLWETAFDLVSRRLHSTPHASRLPAHLVNDLFERCISQSSPDLWPQLARLMHADGFRLTRLVLHRQHVDERAFSALAALADGLTHLSCVKCTFPDNIRLSTSRAIGRLRLTALSFVECAALQTRWIEALCGTSVRKFTLTAADVDSQCLRNLHFDSLEYLAVENVGGGSFQPDVADLLRIVAASRHSLIGLSLLHIFLDQHAHGAFVEQIQTMALSDLRFLHVYDRKLGPQDGAFLGHLSAAAPRLVALATATDAASASDLAAFGCLLLYRDDRSGMVWMDQDCPADVRDRLSGVCHKGRPLRTLWLDLGTPLQHHTGGIVRRVHEQSD